MSKDFKPQDYFRYKKLGKRWQKPRGLHSKLRESRKGAGTMPTVSYRRPAKFRGLVRGVVRARVVKSLRDIGDVQENESIIVAASVGKKKSAAIAEAAAQRGITVLNKKSAEAAKKRAGEIAARLAKKEKKPKAEEKKEKTEAKAEQKDEQKNESK